MLISKYINPWVLWFFVPEYRNTLKWNPFRKRFESSLSKCVVHIGKVMTAMLSWHVQNGNRILQWEAELQWEYFLDMNYEHINYLWTVSLEQESIDCWWIFSFATLCIETLSFFLKLHLCGSDIFHPRCPPGPRKLLTFIKYVAPHLINLLNMYLWGLGLCYSS